MADPYASFGTYAPPQPPSAAGGGGYEAFGDYQAPVRKPAREVGEGESFGRGALSGATFGFNPALSGVAAAGEGASPLGSNSPADTQTIAGRASAAGALKPIMGAARLIKENVIDPLRGVNPAGLKGLVTGDDAGPATKAYRKVRDTEREAQEQAFEQNPKSYIGGALTGGVITTPAAPFKAATTLGRIGESAAVGAGAGALGGAGESISRGDTLADTIKNTALGTVVGGGVGGIAGSAVEGLGSAARRLASGVRAIRRPEDEALRQIGETLQADRARTPPLSPQELATARRIGLPMSTLEQGGQATRELARTAADRSPAAWDAIRELTQDRFKGQSGRVENFVNNMFGGLDNPQLAEDLKSAYQKATTPLYQRAYAAGDKPIISPELEQLLGSRAIGQAMGQAVKTGQDRAIVQGMGAFRPYVRVTDDGRVVFPPGPKGVPSYPNLQLWDYTQRELSDMIAQSKLRGRTSETAVLTQLDQRLKAELDRQVPEFRAARASAAEYFGANNALEAGKNFVRSNVDLNESGRQLSRMPPPERELFARGFAGKFIQDVASTSDSADVLKRIGQSPVARRKLVMAMGPQRANQVNAVLHVEALADRARGILAGPDTAKKLSNLVHAGGHGAGGAGAVALYEYLNEGGFDPVHVLLGGAALGGLRLRLGHADQEVARHIGELLASQDPTVVDRAYRMIAGHPRIFSEIRRLALGTTGAAVRTAGPGATAAAGAAALEHLHAAEPDHQHGHHLDNILDQQQQ